MANRFDELGHLQEDLQQPPESPVYKTIEPSQDFQDSDLRSTGPLKKLYARSTSQDLLFPSDLADIEHFCVFRIRERTFASTDALRTASAPATKDSKNIMLPMPPELSTKYGANYNTATGGGISAVLQGGASLADFDSEGILGGLMRLGLENTGVGGEIAQAALGKAANPFQAVFFQNPELRTHSFSYTLSAKTQQESNSIRNIIREFKTAMLPTFAGNKTFFNYPKVFEIEFRFDEYLFEIGTSVLTSFDVSYHGENTPSYFDLNKAPTVVKIAMSFQEANILTANDVEGSILAKGNRK